MLVAPFAVHCVCGGDSKHFEDLSVAKERMGSSRSQHKLS